MPLFLGIDGGGTRTIAWLANERTVLGRAVAGPSNPLKVGFESAQREILRAVRAAVAAVGVAANHRAPRRNRRHGMTGVAKRRDGGLAPAQRHYGKRWLEAVVVGLAGVDRPPVHRRMLAWFRKSVPARRILLTSDAAVALHAAAGNTPGLIVISGTGSIAYGRDQNGRVLRAGGWGTLFDDAGSGYDLGRKAVTAALGAIDGRGPATRLASRIARALGIRELTRVVFRPPEPRQLAGLFPLVLEAARQGDRVARRLCEEAGSDLAELALALLRRMGWRRRAVPVVCAGGVFQSSARIRRSFARHLRRHAPAARIVLLRRPPVEGALAMARALSAEH